MLNRKSQLVESLNATVIVSAGRQTLEMTERGDLVVSDGWFADWITIYPLGLGWAHDGTLSFNKPITKYLNKKYPR